METALYVTTLAQSVFAPALIVGLFYGSDKLLSTAASKSIAEAIMDVAAQPKDSKWSAALQEFLAEHFPPRGNPGKFWFSVLLSTLVSLLIVLAIYSAQVSGLVGQLLTPGFLRQFIGNGLLITLLVNAFAYWQYRNLLQSFVSNSIARNLLWILADLCAKAILFIFLTAIIYCAFALTSRAFNGSVESALRAVPITVHDALFFRNLTSVYIYSLTLSSFPIFLAVIVKLFVLHPAFARASQRILFFLPLAEKPVRAAAIIFAFFSSLFCLILSVLLSPALQVLRQ